MQAEPVESTSTAVVRGLDRINGRHEDYRLVVGHSLTLGTLEISLRDCRHDPLNPALRAYAFLDIVERGTQETLFSAWMVSASPALSALDHHRYDVWLLGCSTESEPDGKGSEENVVGRANAESSATR